MCFSYKLNLHVESVLDFSILSYHVNCVYNIASYITQIGTQMRLLEIVKMVKNVSLNLYTCQTT